MSTIAAMLRDLGFQCVVGILDNNVEVELNNLKTNLSDFLFLALPARDVQSKSAREATLKISGLLDRQGNLYCRYREPLL